MNHQSTITPISTQLQIQRRKNTTFPVNSGCIATFEIVSLGDIDVAGYRCIGVPTYQWVDIQISTFGPLIAFIMFAFCDYWVPR